MNIATIKLLILTTFSACFFLETSAYATEIPIYDISDENYSINNFSLSVLTDSSRQMQIEEVENKNILPQIVNSRFFIKSTEMNYWFIFKIKNTSSTTLHRIIGFDEIYMDIADIYYRTDSGWHHEPNGLSQPIEQRKIKNRCPIFSVSLKSNETKTIYLKLHSNFSNTVGIFIEDIPVYAQNEQLRIIIYWSYFGAAFALLIHNLLIFIRIKELAYVYYLIYTSFLILFTLLYSGFSLYLYSDPQTHYLLHTSIGIMGGVFALFIREILKLKGTGWIDNALIATSIGFFVLAVLISVDIYFYQWVKIYGLLAILLFPYIGIYCLVHKIPLARYYSIAMSGYLIGLFLASSLSLNLIPYNLLTRYGFLFGSIIELTVFSLALGQRLKLLQQEKLIVQSKLLDAEKSMKNKLKIQVKERTKKLETQNKQLAKLQSFKEDVVHMIAHDLKNALNTIINISKNSNKNKALRKVYEIGNFSLRLTTNMLDIKRMREAELSIETKAYTLNEIIEKAINKVSYWKNQFNITIDTKLKHNYLVNIDYGLTIRILINLLENAVKASQNNQRITITVTESNDSNLIVSIKDNGHGFSEQQLKLLFQKFEYDTIRTSKNMLSTGMGLAFCKLAIEKQGGRIWVESTGTKGTIICFALPFVEVKVHKANKKQTEVNHTILLNHAEKELLKIHAEKLATLKCHQAKSILDILSKISHSDSIQIAAWTESLQNCVFTGNSEQYENIIKAVCNN